MAGCDRKKSIRDEAEVINRDHAMKKLGLIEIIKLLLVIPIKMVIVIRFWICMICAKG